MHKPDLKSGQHCKIHYNLNGKNMQTENVTQYNCILVCFHTWWVGWNNWRYYCSMIIVQLVHQPCIYMTGLCWNEKYVPHLSFLLQIIIWFQLTQKCTFICFQLYYYWWLHSKLFIISWYKCIFDPVIYHCVGTESQSTLSLLFVFVSVE